ncbi:MAG: type II toxin-antitoxin system VapB family antitoxin [Thermodesulfobacteriota bacterium]|jgi:Arc/MetJ family transcription regulator
MKTLVDINEDVLREAMELSEAGTKKEVIMLALEELIRSKLREKLKQSAGSGMIETRLSDLKRIRHSREKVHRNLQMVKR